MRDVAIDDTHRVSQGPSTGERGFVAGLLGASLVILLDSLIRLLVTGGSTGSFDLGLASELSLLVLVAATVAAVLFSSHRARRRAQEEYDVVEAEIERAEGLIKELGGELKRGG